MPFVHLKLFTPSVRNIESRHLGPGHDEMDRREARFMECRELALWSENDLLDVWYHDSGGTSQYPESLGHERPRPLRAQRAFLSEAECGGGVNRSAPVHVVSLQVYI